MSIIDNALDDSTVDKPRPIIPEAVPALEEVRPPAATPTPNEIIRRAYESLP